MGFLAPMMAGGMGGLGSLLGIGLGAASFLAMNKMMKSSQSNAASQLMNIQNQNNAALGEIPEMPEAPTGNPADGTEDSTNEAEKERARQLAAMQKQAQAANPTGGLGVSGTPTVRKKQALGG